MTIAIQKLETILDGSNVAVSREQHKPETSFLTVMLGGRVVALVNELEIDAFEAVIASLTKDTDINFKELRYRLQDAIANLEDVDGDLESIAIERARNGR